MKNKGLAIWIILAAALSPGTARADGTGHAQILAHGTDKSLWLVYATPGEAANGTDAQSEIRLESFPGGQWKRVTTLGGQAIALADLNGQLIVALDNGQWMQVDPFSTGLPIPGSQDILALAASNNVVWAISLGQLTQASASTTAPVTRMTAATMTTTRSSATAASAMPAILFSLGTNWQAVTPLPIAKPPTQSNLVSLAIVDDVPRLALLDGSTIRTYRYPPNQSRWEEMGTVQPPFEVRQVRLLAAADRMILFYAGDRGRCEFCGQKPDGSWAEATTVQPPADPSSVLSLTAAMANGQLHVFAAARVAKRPLEFLEEIYGADGKQVHRFAQIVLPAAATGGQFTFWWWVNVIVAGALVLLMFDAVRRRRAKPPTVLDPSKITLAPLAMRFLGGIIDMIPMVGVIVIYYSLHPEIASDTKAMLNDPGAQLWWVMAMVAYIMVAAVTECLAGRTVGKMITGLDVVSIDGSRPTRWSLVLRNLLRWVDFYLMMAPLALIFFSPLRMRLGDAAAGTLVIQRDVNQE